MTDVSTNTLLLPSQVSAPSANHHATHRAGADAGRKAIPLPQFPDGIFLTNSAAKCWNACRRRYYFAYILGVRKAYASEPLRIGSMWHMGVGAYENGQAIDDVEDMIRQAYADQGCPPYLQPDEFAVEEEKVIAMIRGHYHRYKDDRIIESVAVELAFALPLRNPETSRPTPSFLDAGMIDRIGKLPDGTFALVERKTTSEQIEPDSPYWKALRNDPQISRYLQAARTLGYDTTKVVYDVIKKPNIRPKQVVKADMAYANANGHYFGMKLTGPCPDRETPKMYGARLLADMKDRPEFYFSRVEIARLDDDLKEFSFDLWNTQRDIQEAKRTGRFTRNASSCLEPFNCEYLDVCHELHTYPESVPSGFRRVGRLHEELPQTLEPTAL